jgi:hypothetical protein
MENRLSQRVATGLVVILVAELAWLGGPSLLARIQPPRSIAVEVESLHFYGAMRYKECRSFGNPTRSFPATIAQIYDRETFAWRGYHTLHIEYDSPRGQVYSSSDVKGKNLSSTCGYMPVNGQEAAALPGQWQIRFSIGDHSLASRSFLIRRIGPDPQLIIPPLLCQHGCSATLRTPTGARLHMRLSSRAALVRYLARDPGSRIDLIVGSER